MTTDFRDRIVFRVIDVHPRQGAEQNAKGGNFALITKDTKLILRPKLVISHQQTLRYEKGLDVGHRVNKGPLEVRIVSRASVDESIKYDDPSSKPSSHDRQTSANRIITDYAGMVLSIELTVSASRFANQGRTFHRLVPPNEHTLANVDKYMNIAMNIVDDANAKLSPISPEGSAQISAGHEISPNREDVARIGVLYQAVFAAVDEIMKEWSKRGIGPDEGVVGRTAG